MRFNPKLGHVTCSKCQINVACTKFTTTIYKPCDPGVPPHQQPLHHPVKYFTYWPVLGYLKNWKIIHFSHKATSSEDIEKNCQVVLDGIGEKMAALVQTGKHGAINTTDTTTMGYYAIKLFLEGYTLQEDTMCDRKICTAGGIFFKS